MRQTVLGEDAALAAEKAGKLSLGDIKLSKDGGHMCYWDSSKWVPILMTAQEIETAKWLEKERKAIRESIIFGHR